VPHPPSPAGFFTVRMGKCPFCPLPWSFPHDSHCYKPSPLQGWWAGAATPAFSGLFIHSFPEGVPLSHSPELRAPCPLCYMSFFFFFQLLTIQVGLFLFSLGGGESVQGAMLICPREYWEPLICSPGGLLLPSRLGAGVWQHSSPPGFSV
jgi:hypothetical protein